MKLETCIFVILSVIAVVHCQDGCPVENPNIAWGCAYTPHCFGDSSCPDGQKCCRHICGDRCVSPSSNTGSLLPDKCHGKISLSCLLGK